MIAQHNEITTAEDFLDFMTPDGENGFQNHEFVCKPKLEGLAPIA
jgi:hypothetical protein